MRKPTQIRFQLKRRYIFTKMDYNINIDSAIAGSFVCLCCSFWRVGFTVDVNYNFTFSCSTLFSWMYKCFLFCLACLCKYAYQKIIASWSWSYGIWIYNYLCNQSLSSLTLWVQIPLRWDVLHTTLCDKVCQWLAAGR